MPEPTYVLQPTPGLVWGQSAVVATVEPVTVNLVSLDATPSARRARFRDRGARGGHGIYRARYRAARMRDRGSSGDLDKA